MTRQGTLRGRALVYPRAHINTDEIIPARYLHYTDEAFFARHAMEDLDPKFVEKVRQGDILVVGENFGCGSSREHAIWALRGAGVAAVIGASFARIFFRNAINSGFLAVECPTAVGAAREGDELEIDVEAGRLRNLTSGDEHEFVPLAGFVREIVEAGGLMPYIAARRNSS